MTDFPLRVRSATEIIDAAFALYRRGFQQLVLATALAYAPWLIVQLVIYAVWPVARQPLPTFPPGGGTMATSVVMPNSLILVNVVVAIGSFITYALMSGVLIRLGSEMYLGTPTDVQGALRRVLPLSTPLVLAAFGRGILYGVAGMVGGIFGAIVGGISMILIGKVVGAVLLTLLTFVGLTASFLWIFARMALVNPSIVLEGIGVGPGFSRSLALSRGRTRHLLAALLIVLLVVFLVYIGVLMLAGMFLSTVAAMVLSSVFIILAYPVYGMTEMLLYYDARIRAEGFDVEMMAGALGPPSLSTGGTAP